MRFYVKQKTAYEIHQWLEFRRVLFRSNDFVIRIATVNGTGSASANSLLMKAIFRMGIPVVGKNYFPSNIQGLPTWYEIRVTKDAYLSRSGHIDIMIAMNAQTYKDDLVSVQSGGFFIYDSDRKSTRLNSSHWWISYAVFCLKKKK